MHSSLNVSFHEFGASSHPVINDSFDVITKYAIERPVAFSRAFRVLGIDLPRSLGLISKENQVATLARKHSVFFSLANSPANLVSSVSRALHSSWSYLTGNPIVNDKEKTASVKSLSKVVRDTAEVLDPASELGTFLTKAILFIPKESLRVLKGINGFALTFLMTWNACESFSTLIKKPLIDRAIDPSIQTHQQEKIAAFLGLSKEISFAALGILTLLSAFTTLSYSPLLAQCFIVSSAFFSISHFYYQNIGQEKQISGR